MLHTDDREVFESFIHALRVPDDIVSKNQKYSVGDTFIELRNAGGVRIQALTYHQIFMSLGIHLQEQEDRINKTWDELSDRIAKLEARYQQNPAENNVKRPVGRPKKVVEVLQDSNDNQGFSASSFGLDPEGS